MSPTKGDVIKRIKEGLQHDSIAKELVKLAQSNKTQRFWVDDAVKPWSVDVSETGGWTVIDSLRLLLQNIRDAMSYDVECLGRYKLGHKWHCDLGLQIGLGTLSNGLDALQVFWL
nr:Transposon Tf2-2 polyprotein [Ipomoea batatas]